MIFSNLIPSVYATKGDIVGFPNSYSQIMKSLAETGMPYHSQSLLVATLCRELAQNYRRRELKSESQYVLLQDAFDQCLSTINATAEVTRAKSNAGRLVYLEGFDPEYYDQQECTRLFRNTVETLSACFAKLEISQTDQAEARLLEAVAKDA
ncbi:hypothetical protein FRC07_007141, partial [Ceratobasidium sp. 392]